MRGLENDSGELTAPCDLQILEIFNWLPHRVGVAHYDVPGGLCSVLNNRIASDNRTRSHPIQLDGTIPSVNHRGPKRS